MSPDKKYMPNTGNNDKNEDKNDLNLVPFNTSMPSDIPIGWIPILPFSKLNQIGVTSAIPSFNLPNVNQTDKIPQSESDTSLNVENYPSDETIDNLFSYNKAPVSGSNNNSKNNKKISGNINRSENISEVLRNYTADLDENIDLCRHCSDKRIDKIYKKIEEKDPEVITMLTENYKIPCPLTKMIIRKIIKLTLYYCKKDGD